MISHRVKRLPRTPLLSRFAPSAQASPDPKLSWTPVPEPLHGPQIVFDQGVRVPLPPSIEQGLADMRQKERTRVWLEEIARFVLVACSVLLGQILLDALFNLPWLIRALFLGGDFFLLQHLWRRFRETLCRPGMSDDEAAARVEKYFGIADGSLAGAVELSRGEPGANQGSSGLLSSLIENAARSSSNIRMSEAVSLSRAAGGAVAGGITLALALAFLLLNWPASGVWLQRLVLLNPDPPSGTRVVEGTGNLVIQSGGTASLSAKASGFVPQAGHVRLSYLDGEEEEVPVRALPGEPARFGVEIAGIQRPFRYRFFLHDAEGEEYLVKVETAPVLLSLKKSEKDAETGKELSGSGKIFWYQGQSLNLLLTASAPLKSATLILEARGKKTLVPMKIEGFGAKTARAEVPAGSAAEGRITFDLLGENNLKASDSVIFPVEYIPAVQSGEESPAARPAASGQGLRARDREALIRLQAEPAPREATAAARQYFKNISEEGRQP